MTASTLHRLLFLVVMTAAAGLTGGCADKPPPRVAAMVPLGTNGDYGYSEKMISPDLYTVRFTSPSLRATEDDAASHGLEGEKQRAYDMALWRAAQLAQQEGKPAFEVQQESRDVDVTVQRDRVYPTYVPGPYFYGRHHRWPGYWPGYYPYDYGYYDRYRTKVTGRIVVDLNVKLLPKMTDGAFDAAATAARLSKSYGGASYPLTKGY